MTSVRVAPPAADRAPAPGRPLSAWASRNRLHLYVVAVCALGLLCATWAAAGTGVDALDEHAATFALLSGLVLLGELLPIVVSRGDTQDEVTVSTTFVLALVLVGPLALALAVQAVAVVLEDARAGKGTEKALFNAAQYALSLLAARVAFCAVTGEPLLDGRPLDVPGDLVPALVAGLAFLVVNNTLVGIAIAFAQRVPVLRQITGDVRFQLATSGVLISFSPVVAHAVVASAWLTPLLLLPIGAVYRSARLAADREHAATHDTLTDLPNRVLFRRRLTRAIDEARRSGTTFAVVLVDLDHFKEINDTLGHSVGDELLVEVAQRISEDLRPGDTVARLGGDEFAVVTSSPTSAAEAVVVAHRLLASLEEPFVAEHVRLDVQASLGIAVFPEHATTADTLVQHADIAMYDAKGERGSVRVYRPDGLDRTPERLALAAELRNGLRGHELYVVFQPKVALADGRPVGFEALVRWRHPRRGVLLPDEFLPVVENTGLVSSLTMTVLAQSLTALAGWRAAGHDVSMAVNLSVRHLTDLDLPAKVASVLEDTGVAPDALTLEITETVLMSDPGRAVSVLSGLRSMGISLAIDDFGTGYSSLSYLQRLHVDELKIDKSFVLGLGRDEGNAAIVRSTIDMGHNLGLRVVAEGIEEPEVLERLRGWGCDVAQGFGIALPLLATEVERWLDGRTREVVGVGSGA